MIPSGRCWIWCVAGVMVASMTMAAEDAWEVHDMRRPWPGRATPHSEEALTARATAPEGAMVLFQGSDFSRWHKADGSPVGWKLADGAMEIVPGGGGIQTREGFGSCRLHLEWRTPADSSESGQDRGNSGVFLMNLYEVQILDTYENRTYADGMAGAIYGQSPPSANALRPAGEWQYYDIEFHAPAFDETGRVVKPARMSVWVNGVLVQDDFELKGATAHKRPATYRAHPAALPLALQDHDSPVQFRNIWLQPLD